MSLQDNIALIGAYYQNSYTGSAYIFSRSRGGGSRSQTAKLEASGGATFRFFGGAASLSNNIALIGARGGAALMGEAHGTRQQSW